MKSATQERLAVCLRCLRYSGFYPGEQQYDAVRNFFHALCSPWFSHNEGCYGLWQSMQNKHATWKYIQYTIKLLMNRTIVVKDDQGVLRNLHVKLQGVSWDEICMAGPSCPILLDRTRLRRKEWLQRKFSVCKYRMEHIVCTCTCTVWVLFDILIMYISKYIYIHIVYVFMDTCGLPCPQRTRRVSSQRCFVGHPTPEERCDIRRSQGGVDWCRLSIVVCGER